MRKKVTLYNYICENNFCANFCTDQICLKNLCCLVIFVKIIFCAAFLQESTFTTREKSKLQYYHNNILKQDNANLYTRVCYASLLYLLTFTALYLFNRILGFFSCSQHLDQVGIVASLISGQVRGCVLIHTCTI